MPLPTLRRVSKKVLLILMKSGKSPRTFHAEGESLGAFNRYGSSVNMHFLCLCSRGSENDSTAHETSGVVCLGHGEGCGRSDGEGRGEEGGGEEHEDEAEDGGEEERGLGEHVGWFGVVEVNVRRRLGTTGYGFVGKRVGALHGGDVVLRGRERWKGGLCVKINSSRAGGRGFYGSLIVEIEAGKKKEVDDEQGGSS